ncbi:hypothetical protein HPB51_015226 [Rhipicephalus microplus]|uniref:Uncharacterized protein n=1 Tax=Rhipicephalus microplus TaxID=6941 RepID=A0A9J6E9S6_RHIMP|nr:hypothetical protein HPB51_015226 [Rhipicephalus microplus]
MARYQTLVEELLARSDATRRHGNEKEEEESLFEDSQAALEDVEFIDTRAATAEQLLTLVSRPPSRSFQAYTLWEITERFLDGKHVGFALGSYLVEVFTDVRRAPSKPKVLNTDSSLELRPQATHSMCGGEGADGADRKGTTFLKGKEYVHLLKFHIAAFPNLTRLK